MPNTFDDSKIQLIQQKWQLFGSKLFSELSELTAKQKEFNVEIKRIESIEKVIKQSVGNADMILKYKKVFLEVDPDLSVIISALEQFKTININNSVVPALLKKITDSEKIKALTSRMDELILQSAAITSQIEQLSDMRLGISFDDELIKTLATKYGFSSYDTRLIRFYPVIKSGKKVEKKISVELRTNVQPSEEPVEVIEEPEVSNTSELEELNALKERYQSLKEQYKELFGKYYVEYAALPANSRDHYDYFASLPSLDEHKVKPDTVTFASPEYQAKVITKQVMLAKEQVDSLFKELQDPDFMDVSFVELLREQLKSMKLAIDKYEEKLQLLAQCDEKIRINKETPIENPIDVYFLLDNIGYPFEFSDEEISILSKISASGLIAKKPVRDPDNIPDTIGRKVYFRRTTNNLVVSFVRVGAPDSRDYNLLILAASSIKKNGLGDLINKTNKLLNIHSSMIREQIDSIEARSPQYMEYQARAIDEAKKSTSGRGEH